MRNKLPLLQKRFDLNDFGVGVDRQGQDFIASSQQALLEPTVQIQGLN